MTDQDRVLSQKVPAPTPSPVTPGFLSKILTHNISKTLSALETLTHNLFRYGI